MSGNVPTVSETSVARIVQAVRELFEGRSNAVGTFTLTANAGSTVVTSINCGAGSSVLCFPTTANAAAAVATTYIGTVTNGTFTVTHANNAQVDKTFMYVAIG